MKTTKETTMTTTEVIELLKEVAAGIEMEGLDPIKQIAGYICSGDTSYIRILNIHGREAKRMLAKMDAEEVLRVLLTHTLS